MISKEEWLVRSTVLDVVEGTLDVFFSTFCVSWVSKKKDSKDYSFDSYGLLIRAHEKLLVERKLEVKQ